jgi:hypothetical protein
MLLSLVPFLLLTAVVVSILVCQKTNQELIRMLTATFAVVGLIWVLAIAHWSVQLFSLLCILILCQPTNFKTSNKIY